MMRQESIDTILLEAVEIEDATERESYLDRTCGSDAELRQKVEKLIADHFAAGDFLEEPLVERPAYPLDDATEIEGVSLDFLAPSSDPGVLGCLGEYTVTEVIGRGGMGIVLKGHDRHLNRTVAIKVLAPELSGNATARKRFVREAQAAAAIVHQHVITIHAVHEDRLPYLVMEYVHGQSLQERIHLEGPLELKEILRIGTQVASGLAAAHAQGLIHRDVKPANIMLENGVQRVRLTDFGLARAVDDVGITRTGEITGTPQFMSPEQAQGKAIDTRSDLFSLGSVLYAMCTGRSPFRAETTVAALRRVCDDVPRPVREVNPDIPEWLTEIIEHLLEKDADDRIQSATEVADLLGKHLAHLQDPSSTPMPDTIPRAKRRASRAPSAAGSSRRWIIAGSVLLLLAATISVTEATGVTQFSATVISIVRGDGTLVVEVDDPAVGITIEGEDVVITGAGPQEVRLRPGQYRFRAMKDGEPVKQELVTITRGGKKVISVTLESVASKGNGSNAVDYRTVPEGSISRVRRLAGHTGAIIDLQTFRDGARCLTASHDGTIRSWEIPTSRLLHTYRFGNYHGEIRIALAPNQQLAAAGIDEKGTIQLFEVETGKPLQKLSGHSDVVNKLEFSPNGHWLLSRSRDKTLRLWDVETGKELHRLDCEPWWSPTAAFSPGGDALFYGDNGFTICWNVEKKAETWRAGDDEFESQVASLGLSADGRRVAVGTFGGPIHLRDAKTGELLGSFVGHAAKSHSDLAFTPDGRYLLSGNNVDETLRVWSVKTFTEVCRIKADRAIVNKLRVLPDGRDVITAGGMRYEPMEEWIPEGNYDLHVWRLPESVWETNYRAVPDGSINRSSRLQGHTDTITGVAFFSDGQRVLSGSVESLRVWDLKVPELPRVIRPGASVTCIGLSPDNVIGASGDVKGDVILWSMETAREINRIAAHEGHVLQLAFSADGTQLLSTGQDGIVAVWNAQTGDQRYRYDAAGDLWPAAAFIGGSSHLLVADDRELIRWDPLSGEKTWSSELPDKNWYLAVSPNGKFAATDSRGGSIQLWSIETGEPLASLVGHATPADLAFSSDSRHLFSGGKGDGHDTTCRIWSTKTFQEVYRIEADRHFVSDLAVSADGRRLVSGGSWYRDTTQEALLGDDFDLHVWGLPESVWTRPSD